MGIEEDSLAWELDAEGMIAGRLKDQLGSVSRGPFWPFQEVLDRLRICPKVWNEEESVRSANGQ